MSTGTFDPNRLVFSKRRLCVRDMTTDRQTDTGISSSVKAPSLCGAAA